MLSAAQRSRSISIASLNGLEEAVEMLRQAQHDDFRLPKQLQLFASGHAKRRD